MNYLCLCLPQKYAAASELFHRVGSASNVTSTDQSHENRSPTGEDG
jgi:hypothetical protein